MLAYLYSRTISDRERPGDRINTTLNFIMSLGRLAASTRDKSWHLPMSERTQKSFSEYVRSYQLTTIGGSLVIMVALVAI